MKKVNELYEEEEISVREAARILVKEGIIKDSDFNDQSVKRLIRDGVIKAKKHEIQRIGYRVNVTSLKRYIRIGRMSTAQLRKEHLELVAKLEKLEEAVQKVEKNFTMFK